MKSKNTKQPINHEYLRTVVENMLVPHTAFENITKSLEQGLRIASTLESSTGIFFPGESRTGKSRALEEFSSQHLPYRGDEGLISPVLRVEVPSEPSVKGLPSEILLAFGDPLSEKGTARERTNRVVTLIKRCKVKMLIIDEIQHFIDKTDNFKVVILLTDCLKTILNKTKIVVVVAGLPYAKSIFSQNEQLRGRFIKCLHMPRFDWQDNNSRGEFLGLLDGFTQLLAEHFDVPDLGSENLAYRFYLATGGLTGYVINIIRSTVWNILEEERLNITIEDFAIAHQQILDISDTHSISSFSRTFDMTDSQALEKASQIGRRSDETVPVRRYKPRTTREALA
jgi:hypothetical protein